MYDFDKTLCTKDMQEYSFIPDLHMQPQDFWKKSNDNASKYKMDRVLSYMYLMLKEANYKNIPITRESFKIAGNKVEFFPGVLDWFDRIRLYAKKKGENIEVEHYIISSGIKEFIEGSKIADKFKEIYACEFHYNVSGVADWPSIAVNYTAKTQFLFRINKGVLDISKDHELNEYTPENLRRVPFRNMIYFGDGMTDIPCMKLVHINGGKSIGVYTDENYGVAKELLKTDRVDFIAGADYSEGSDLDTYVKGVIESMILQERIINKTTRLKEIL